MEKLGVRICGRRALMRRILILLSMLFPLANSYADGPAGPIGGNVPSDGEMLMCDKNGSATAAVTCRNINPYKYVLDTSAYIGASLVASDACDAGTTASVITAASHSAKVGDIIRITSGTYDDVEVRVKAVAANTITLESTLAGAPAALDTFDILRPRFAKVLADGSTVASPDIADATYGTLVAVAFGSVPAAFGKLFESADADWKEIDIANNTDCLLVISFDAGTTSHYVVPAYSTKEFQFSKYGLSEDSDVYYKYASGEVCAHGSVYLSAIR